MGQRSEVESSRSEEREPIQRGIEINFSNPEVLRAFICDQKMLRKASTLAERMSGIKEVSLGEVSLDGELFESASFTLVVEPDREPRTDVGRPTAIIRADIKLGKKDSNLRKLQLARVSQKKVSIFQDEEDGETQAYNGEEFLNLTDLDKGQGVLFIPWSRNTFRIQDKEIYEKEYQKSPLVLLQVWDKDAGVDLISISLLSNDKYSSNWMAQRTLHEQNKIAGWEVSLDDIDRWRFSQSVGIGVYDPKRFNEAIAFYQRAFSLAMRSLYESEGVDMPNLLYDIESPIILGEQGEITFKDIGGQNEAVHYLQQFADSEKTEIALQMPGIKRMILLAGPPGNGKSTLAEAFAHDLNAPFLKKTTRDLLEETKGDIIKFVDSSILEAKAVARRTNGKAVLCFEQLEALLGQNLTVHDYFMNTMEKLAYDPQTVLIATSNSPDLLHEGIVSKFAQVAVLPPNEGGIKEILEIQTRKITQALGRDIFAKVDLDRLARRLSNMKDLSGRDIAQFLSSAYLLTRGRQLSKLDTETLLQMVPERRFGFKTS